MRTGPHRSGPVKGLLGDDPKIDLSHRGALPVVAPGHGPKPWNLAARGCKFNRLLVLFQPHRYTRTQHLWDEFSRAFNQADVLVLTDIYAANEAPIPGVTSETLGNAIREAGHKNVHYFGSMQEGIGFLLKQARPGDAILTIGAGSVSRASNELMVLLGTEHPAHHAH